MSPRLKINGKVKKFGYDVKGVAEYLKAKDMKARKKGKK